MKTLNDTFKVETWLPVFSGFYGTIWESDNDEEMEIENINEKRKEKGLPEVGYDDIEWAYDEYTRNVSKGFTSAIESELEILGLVDAVTYQKLSSPKEYNFANDSIHVEMRLTTANVKAIESYLQENKEAFTKYVEGCYTSCDGFMSSYSNDADEWLVDLEMTLTHKHKLGAILNFILLNEDKNLEFSIYENLKGNGATLYAKNYAELTEGKA